MIDHLRKFQARLQAGAAGQFLRWWFEELRAMLPAAWRERLFMPRRAVMMRLTESNLEVSVFEREAMHELGLFPLSEDPRLHQHKLRELLRERELLEAPRELLLPASEVLCKDVVMPLAAEAGLSQALAYEMDRQTPFRVEQVYFASRVVHRDRDAGQLRAEVLVVPRQALDAQLERLSARGLPPTGVDVAIDGLPAGVNLLPPEMRHQLGNWRSRFNGALAGLFLLLLAAVMFQSLALRKHQIAEVEAAIEAVRSEATRVQQVRKQIEDAREAAGFLASQRSSAMPTVKVLAEVTRVLPDDTYLDRILIGEGSVQMQGKSRNAQRLIELVNGSGYFSDAAFRGPTRLDSRTQLEIFDLSANTILQAGG